MLNKILCYGELSRMKINIIRQLLTLLIKYMCNYYFRPDKHVSHKFCYFKNNVGISRNRNNPRQHLYYNINLFFSNSAR